MTASERLATLFDARDSSFQYHTAALEAELTPNILAALRILFELPEEDVKWIGFDTFDDMLMIVVHVRYASDAVLSPYLAWSTAASTQSTVEDTTIAELHYCMPFDVVDGTASEIAKMLMDAMVSGRSQVIGAPSGPDATFNDQFDLVDGEPTEGALPATTEQQSSSSLTPDQMASYAFWSSPKPTVH